MTQDYKCMAVGTHSDTQTSALSQKDKTPTLWTVNVRVPRSGSHSTYQIKEQEVENISWVAIL